MNRRACLPGAGNIPGSAFSDARVSTACLRRYLAPFPIILALCRMPPPASIRLLTDLDALHACVGLQRLTWGPDFDDVSAVTLLVCQRIGGLVAGAFDPDDALVGMVFSLLGRQRGHLIHWSHMLAVRPDHQDHGLGLRLKRFQRERVLEDGLSEIHWTFDPLESRNAHFNLNRLGVDIAGYVPDCYGSGASSPRFQGLGTDRWTAVWRLGSERAARALADLPPLPPPGAEQAPFALRRDPQTDEPLGPELLAEPLVRVEIPTDVQALKATSPETAARWRMATRRVFTHYLTRNYRIAGFNHDPRTGRSHYLLDTSGTNIYVPNDI